MKDIDDTDRRILRALVNDGRLSNSELAKTVGLSPSPCWQRVKRLEDSGVISGYTAMLNLEALGVGETVMVEVSLHNHTTEALEKFGQHMANLPEVLEVYMMAGECDYYIKVATDGTRGFEKFLRKRMLSAAKLRHSKSNFSLRCLKRVVSFVPD